ncbi:MAG: hypothetical protein JKY43_00360 [Phycisphaerales bacterium]|nr:hypothetical protein [Phycisphaerales bacterium]
MPTTTFTRFISVLIASTGFMSQQHANAQTMSHPDAVSPMKSNPYFRHANAWRWDLRSQVILQAGIYYRNNSGFREELSATWDIQDFEYIYPIVRQGGFYWSPNEDIQTVLRIDNVQYTPEPEILQTPDSHAKYVWWRSNQRDTRTRHLYFSQVSHIVTADTVFDEKLAKEIPWPQTWPEEATLFLTPTIDRISDPIDPEGQDQLVRLVDQWTEGNDPKSISQVTLTKYLTGKVLDYVRVERGQSQLAPTLHIGAIRSFVNGFSSSPLSSWSGFNVRSADQVALDPAGSSMLDMSMLLTAVLRTAGVPARTVVCYDNSIKITLDERIIVIVEFALYDKARDQILWIPIDLDRLRDNGRGANVYEQNWDYFGTHDYLHNVIPVSYYFHPPVNYKAYGFPGLYGIKTTPDIGNGVTQILSVDVMNTPQTIDDYKPKP